MSDASKPCEWALERIEQYLDGEIDAGERAALEAHCVSCADCARELSLGIRLRRELRSSRVFDVPPSVVERAANEIAAASSNVVPLRTSRLRRRLVLPAIAAAAVALAASLWFTNERREYAGYSQAEIERAHADMALAFGYVDRYSDGVVRSQVIEKRVVPRIERAMRENESTVTSPSPGRS